MKVSELRQWLIDLPAEYNDYDFVWRRLRENDAESWIATDVLIAGSGIDNKTKEAYFCDDETSKIILTDE